MLFFALPLIRIANCSAVCLTDFFSHIAKIFTIAIAGTHAIATNNNKKFMYTWVPMCVYVHMNVYVCIYGRALANTCKRQLPMGEFTALFNASRFTNNSFCELRCIHLGVKSCIRAGL